MDDRAREEVDVAGMIGAELETIAALRASGDGNADAIAAHERVVRYLRDRLEGRISEWAGNGEQWKPIEKLADILSFSVPRSHRAKAMGHAVTGVKRAFVKGLKPLHVEMLRPQQRFDEALVYILRQLVQREAMSPGEAFRRMVETDLAPLANPRSWYLSTHRKGVAAQAVKLAKGSYLRAAGPFLARLLAPQEQWNRAAVATLLAIASQRSVPPTEALALVQQLQDSSDTLKVGALPPALKGSAPLWREVFRRQLEFNRTVTAMLGQLLGVQPSARPAPATPPDYDAWCQRRDDEREAHIRRRLTTLKDQPSFSILVRTRGAQPQHLRACLESVLAQSYPHWELCLLADHRHEAARTNLQRYARRDARIRILGSDATGDVRGDFLCFLDPEGTLAPQALAEVALRLQDDPATDVLYSDEDQLDASGARVRPFFKPGWSPDLLRCCNYMGRPLFFRRSLIGQVGGAAEAISGAEEYDLVLRLSEKTQRIQHIPEVLYHRRAPDAAAPGGTMPHLQTSEAGAHALEAHLQRLGELATVEARPAGYHVRYASTGKPLVSIIVPFKDKPELLKTLVPGLLHGTTYSNFELLLVSNNSVKPETHAYLDSIADPRVRKLTWDHPFNYSSINNYAAEQARGSFLLFLNNDIAVLEPQWLDELLLQAQRPEVGAVGPKLLFPDGRIQHAGVIVGFNGFAGHVFAGFPDEGLWTPFGHADWVRNYLAVTSACVLMRREVFDSIGGYDPRFQVCGGDVDLCLRIANKGLRTVYTPFAKLLHDESSTRRLDAIPERDFWASFRAYLPFLREGDPYYNPNLSLVTTNGQLREESEPTGDMLATRVLARELPGSRVLGVPAAKVRQQKDLAANLQLFDCSSEQAREERASGPKRMAALRARGELKRVTWLVPYFRHPYGGVHTILRFGDLMRSRHGVQSHFVIYDNPNASAAEAEARASAIFEQAPGSFQVLRQEREILDQPACDLAIATLWTSAYFVLRHPRAAAKAYFVQDFEPLFYPAGAMYGLTEQTYRLGLYGIFNTQGLHDYVTQNYPMEGTWFEPTVDHRIFHPNEALRKDRPVRIFFYARPSTDRNAFELGLGSLKELKRRLGSQVEILTAGEWWSPKEYGVEGKIQNLGVLPYEKTADLYRSIDVGLCFMFTKHPSYLPFEMMACGVTVVTNDNPANLWLLKHEQNCLLAQPTFSGVLEQLTRAVEDASLRQRIGRAASERMRQTTWEEQVDRVYATLVGRGSVEAPGTVGIEPPRRVVAR